jgi:hypothetical protein
MPASSPGLVGQPDNDGAREPPAPEQRQIELVGCFVVLVRRCRALPRCRPRCLQSLTGVRAGRTGERAPRPPATRTRGLSLGALEGPDEKVDDEREKEGEKERDNEAAGRATVNAHAASAVFASPEQIAAAQTDGLG